MEKMRMESLDGIETNMDKIATLFPNCVTEAKGDDGKLKKVVNFDLLRQMLSSDVIDGDEVYEFTWVGKKAAIVEANKPVRMTLRPIPEESVNWDTTENLYIEGDNLDVLKLMQESYLGKVKLIYIDPPYNTGSDSFVYPDRFTVEKDEYEEEIGLYDESGNKLFAENNNGNPRFHSDWCSMILSRLILARNLLADDGAIFISIDDNEVENLKKICDEVFGASNFVGQWNWFKSATPPNLSKKIKKNVEYILCYEKKKNNLKYRGLKKTSPSSNGLLNQTNKFAVLNFPANVVESGLADGIYKAGSYGTSNYEINLLDDVTVKDGVFITAFRLQARFKWGQENLMAEIARGTKIAIRTTSFSPSYEKLDYDPEVPPNFINKDVNVDTTEQAGKLLTALFDGIKVFDYPKPVDLLEYLINFICDENDLIMDFFSGSATTAHAVMHLNACDGGKRRFVLVQLPEKIDAQSPAYEAGYRTICDIGKERIIRAGKAICKEKQTTAPIDTGFRVLRLDDTNMKDVYYSADEFTQANLIDMASNIKEDRTSLDLLFGCLLEWGLPLSLPYTSEQIEGYTIHTYNDGDLIACFDENVPDSVVKAIARRQPLRAVFRDSSFADSPAKINVGEIFKLLAPDTRVKVI